MAKNTFTLSANIENGIAESTRYIITPNVQKVLKEIVDGYHTGIHSFSVIGTYGTGKSAFILNLEKDLLKEHQDSKLLNPKVIHDGLFEIVNVVGDVAPLSQLLYEKISPLTDSNETDVLKLLNALYLKLKKQGKFLFIAIDEFGKVLEYAAKTNPEKEIYFFQKFTEYINAPSRNILLLTTLHQNFSVYAGKLNQAQKNEWNKVKGRFQEVVFAEPIEQLLFLAAEHISSQLRYPVTDKGFREIHGLAVDRKFVSSDFPFDIVCNLYPMDTFASYAITRAIQRYGQNERSLFSFLHSRGSSSISSFRPSTNTTYSLSNVYDYVLNTFHSYLNDANSDSTGWSAIRIAIERVEGSDWKTSEEMLDAIKIVKSIGMINLFGNAGFTFNLSDATSYAELALAIERPSVILHKLLGLKIIRYAEYKKRVILFEGTDINIEEEIEKASLTVAQPQNIIDDMRVYFNNRVTPVKACFYHRGTPRYFEYDMRETPELVVPTGDCDGFVQMIFPKSIKAFQEVCKFSKECETALIFAFFNNSEELSEHLYNIQKYRYIIEKILVDKSDRVALKELALLIEYEKTLLNKLLNESMFSYDDSVVWIYKGKIKDIKSQTDFNKLLSEVCDDVYSKTPVINNELFNKYKLSSSISGAKAKYLQALLENSDKEDLGFDKEKFPPEKTIYYTLLKNTGLHLNGDFTDAPTNRGIKTLWDVCEEFLYSTMERPRKLSELIKILSSQPYKIKDGVLEFWLPTYLFIKRQDYALYGQNGQYIPNFNFELLDLMKKHMGEFKIKAYSVDGLKIQLFNQYRKFLRLDDSKTIKGSTFIETIKPFLYFYSRQLNEYAKHTNSLSHEETIKFRNILARAKDPEKAFLEDLPRALGYDDEMLRDKNAMQEYCSTIQRSVNELRGCYNQLIDRIEENLIEKLGLESPEYSEYINEIHNRLYRLKQHILTPRQKEFYQHAMTCFEKRNEWYQSICYAVLDAPLDRLRDEQEPKLHDDLIFLFKECEQKAVLSESLNYRIDEAEEKHSKELEVKINKILTGNKNLDIYTLMRVLQKHLDNE